MGRDRYAALLQFIGAERAAALVACGRLAHFTGHAGDAASARDQLAALLPVLNRVSGAGHRATQAARVSLASWTEQAGRSPSTRKDGKPS